VKQITLRGLDDRTAKALQDLADREGLSLNRAALRLLKSASAAPAPPAKRIGHALDSRVDPELWKRRS